VSANELRPDRARNGEFDLIVVGGGVHGACLALEAARRGLRPLLLERGDFGGETTANSLRILHGGLRYLQSGNLARVRTSIRERRWFCRTFPDLVRPLSCLMPLYGRKLYRPGILRPALAINDLLSAHRNRGVPAPLHLPRGRILDPQQTVALFPGVARERLLGSALWYDAMLTSSEQLLTEIVRWTESLGGTALDHVEAVGLRTAGGRTTGVRAVEHATGASIEFHAPVVVNCAGPWAPQVAAAFGNPTPALFTRALGFNLLLNRRPVSEAALAVEPPGGGRMLFLVPWNGLLMAGTHHAAWPGSRDDPVPEEDQVREMLTALNAALPGFGVRSTEVVRVMAGFMPSVGPGAGTPTSRPVILDHVENGGPRGFYSAVGVKYTTARDVAERVLRRIYGRRPVQPRTERPGPDGTFPLPVRERSNIIPIERQ
jgi:glycerol-3-phosphate dehydrogenase